MRCVVLGMRNAVRCEIWCYGDMVIWPALQARAFALVFLLFSDWSSCPGAGPAAARVCAMQKRFMLQGRIFSFDCTDECAFLRRIERYAVRLHFRRFWLSSWQRGR